MTNSNRPKPLTSASASAGDLEPLSASAPAGNATSGPVPAPAVAPTFAGASSVSVPTQVAVSAQATDESLAPASVRLQKFLARAGVASRRASEELITAGRVAVNGVTVTELGTKIDPQTDTVSVDGRPVGQLTHATTIMLHKPAGVLTTMDDPQGRRTVAQIIPHKRYPGLYPIGRLDRDTTGVLLFSTDGELGHELLHPSHHVAKTYWALVEGRPTPQALATLAQGVALDDGLTAPAQVRILTGAEKRQAQAQLALPKGATHAAQRLRSRAYKGKNTSDSIVELIITEGRNHQVKRMLSAVGYPVIALHRQQFGPLEVGDLQRGQWRELTEAEVAALHAFR